MLLEMGLTEVVNLSYWIWDTKIAKESEGEA